MNRYKSFAVMSLAALVLTACASGDFGDILGGGSSGTYEIRGVVDSVDSYNRTITLTNVSGRTTMLSSGNTVRVHYQEGTPVEYQGQTYRPENLERGDEVSVRVDESGNSLVAERVTVLYDASGTGGSGTYASTVRGTIRYIDTSRGTIEIDRGSGSLTTVEIASSTPVYYSGRTYRPSDLERGDEVEIRIRDMGNNRFLAQDITVVRSVSGGTTGSSTAVSTLRGTVQWVDQTNRTMQLSSVSWTSQFVPGGSNSGTTTTIRFDNNLGVEVQGRIYPIANLERGDVVDVRVRDLGGSYLTAERIVLVRDARQ